MESLGPVAEAAIKAQPMVDSVEFTGLTLGSDAPHITGVPQGGRGGPKRAFRKGVHKNPE